MARKKSTLFEAVPGITDALERYEENTRRYQAEADAYCESQGLNRLPAETAEQHIERMRAWIHEKAQGGILRRMPPSTCEPSDDDEEVAA